MEIIFLYREHFDDAHYAECKAKYLAAFEDLYASVSQSSPEESDAFWNALIDFEDSANENNS